MDHLLDKYVFRYTKKYIGRTHLTKDGLPDYSDNEEIVNMSSHLIGVLIGIGALIASVITSHSQIGLIGGLIFGLSLIVLYAVSSAYHGIPRKFIKEKQLFRVFDHCSIFVLIAGTSAPFILSLIYRSAVQLEWLFYAAMWGMALSGITLLSINLKRYMSLATVMYVIMGTALIARIDELQALLGADGTALFLAGGGVYLVGLLCYGLGSKQPWMHSVFHVLCLFGSVLHCVCVFGYLI